jgi:hypothetical protein
MKLELNTLNRAQLQERKEALISEARELASGDDLTGNDLERFETLEKDIKAVSEGIGVP